MDDQLLQRVLMRVLHRADKADTTCTEPVSKLRIVGGYSFSLLLGHYCWAAIKGTEDGLNAASAIVALVASGCFYLGKIIEAAKADGGSYGAKLVMDLLLSPRVANSGLSILEKYNFFTSQRRCLWHHPELVTRVLLTACESADFDLTDPSVTDLLVMYTNTHRPIVKAVFEEARAQGTLPARARELSKAILRRGLHGTASGELSLQAIINLADPLSIYFAAGELWWTPRQQAVTTSGADAVAVNVLVEAIQKGNAVWPQLLGSAVDTPTKRALHSWAQEQLFSAVTRVPLDNHANVHAMIDRHLDVLDLTHHAVRGEDDTAVLFALNDKLRDLERQITSGVTATMTDRDGVSGRLRILLHVCTLHLRSPEIESEGNRQARANLLATLCSLLLHPHIQTQPGTAEYIFDLASVLGESLPESALACIARTINTRDPRIHAILGSISAPTDTWLALVSQAQNIGATTAQQRALAKHPSAHAHGQPSNTRAAGALGRRPRPSIRSRRLSAASAVSTAGVAAYQSSWESGDWG
ncbi:RNA polymerase II mediator complex subunit [Friedmanniomyces endolithicus]|nr:RNA polymerase II mediator complex subunit [Friedmanniomyces endolithicus]